jgi:hypothetical protein
MLWRKAAAVGVLLRFFRFGVFAFEAREVTLSDS